MKVPSSFNTKAPLVGGVSNMTVKISCGSGSVQLESTPFVKSVVRTSFSSIINSSPSHTGNLFFMVIQTSVSSEKPGGGPGSPS